MTVARISDIQDLEKENVNLRSQLDESNQKISCLEEQLSWLKRQIFGRKSERAVSDLNREQLESALLNELDRASTKSKPVGIHNTGVCQSSENGCIQTE